MVFQINIFQVVGQKLRDGLKCVEILVFQVKMLQFLGKKIIQTMMIYKNLICLSCCKLKSQHDNVLYTNRTSTRLQCIKSVHNEILSSEITKINLNRKFLLWRLISDVSIDDIVFERGGGSL